MKKYTPLAYKIIFEKEIRLHYRNMIQYAKNRITKHPNRYIIDSVNMSKSKLKLQISIASKDLAFKVIELCHPNFTTRYLKEITKHK